MNDTAGNPTGVYAGGYTATRMTKSTRFDVGSTTLCVPAKTHVNAIIKGKGGSKQQDQRQGQQKHPPKAPDPKLVIVVKDKEEKEENCPHNDGVAEDFDMSNGLGGMAQDLQMHET